MKSALLIDPHGKVNEIEPLNGTDFSLEECYKYCNCDLIEIVRLKDGSIMILDEEGKLKSNYMINEKATVLFAATHGHSDIIVGTVIVCPAKMLK